MASISARNIKKMLIFFRFKMDANPTSEDSITFTRHLQELPSRNSSSTISLFNTCIFDVDYNVLKRHLENHQMQQSMLDKCLLARIPNLAKLNPTRSGGGALKAPPPSDFLLSRIEFWSCIIVRW